MHWITCIWVLLNKRALLPQTILFLLLFARLERHRRRMLLYIQSYNYFLLFFFFCFSFSLSYVLNRYIVAEMQRSVSRSLLSEKNQFARPCRRFFFENSKRTVVIADRDDSSGALRIIFSWRNQPFFSWMHVDFREHARVSAPKIHAAAHSRGRVCVSVHARARTLV